MIAEIILQIILISVMRDVTYVTDTTIKFEKGLWNVQKNEVILEVL